MGLRDKLRRLEREAAREGVILHLRDGGLRVFDQMEVAKEMFLTQMDFLGARYAPPRSWTPCALPLRRAVPPSRQRTGA